MAHGLQQRVDGPAVFQVPHHVDVDVVQTALGLPDGVEIEQGLGRMLVGSVTGIDDRHRGHFRGIARTAFERMPHDDEVYVVGHHLNSVLEAFSLTDTGVAGVRETDDSCAKTVDRRLKAQTGPGGRLEEDTGHHLVAEKGLRLVVLKLLRHIEDVQDLLLGEILD